MSTCTKCPEDLKAICIEHYGNDGSPNCASKPRSHTNKENTVKIKMDKTAFKLLAAQKRTLLSAINKGKLSVKDTVHLRGIVHLIDVIQRKTCSET